eukprot:6491604-Amphidinium_carterae.2
MQARVTDDPPKVAHSELRSRSICANLACDSFTTSVDSSARILLWSTNGQFNDVSRSSGGCADDPSEATLKSRSMSKKVHSEIRSRSICSHYG